MSGTIEMPLEPPWFLSFLVCMRLVAGKNGVSQCPKISEDVAPVAPVALSPGDFSGPSVINFHQAKNETPGYAGVVYPVNVWVLVVSCHFVKTWTQNNTGYVVTSCNKL